MSIKRSKVKRRLDYDKLDYKNVIDEISEAQEILQEGYERLRSVLRTLPGSSSYEAYILGHLDNWINGGNPYDETIPVIIEDLEKELY